MNQNQAAAAIANRETFTASALSGRDGRFGPWDCGRLSGADLDQYRADMSNIAYAVYSYATPIAWVTTDGSKHVVTQRFSRTTTARHMPAARSL